MESKNSNENTERNTNVLIKLKDLITRTFTGHSKKTWIWITIFLIITVLTVFLFYLQFLDETFLFGIVINYFAIPVLKMGWWGFLIFILFMGIQGVLLPIPSELVLLSSGLIWGIFTGGILGIIGSMFAGALTYYISMKGGRPLAEKFVGAENLAVVDRYIEKYGGKVIFAARAFPFMAFDPISYASGLVKIKTSTYMFATFVGSIIRCFIYSYLGSSLISEGQDLNYFIQPENRHKLDGFISENAVFFNTMFLVIVIVVVIFFGLYQFVLLPYLKRKQRMIIKEDQELTTSENKTNAVETEEHLPSKQKSIEKSNNSKNSE